MTEERAEPFSGHFSLVLFPTEVKMFGMKSRLLASKNFLCSEH